MTNFRLFQEFADDNFEFDENGIKFSKWAENTVLKGESNFSFSRSVFKRLLLKTRKNQGLFGKGLKKNNCICSTLTFIFQGTPTFVCVAQRHLYSKRTNIYL